VRIVVRVRSGLAEGQFAGLRILAGGCGFLRGGLRPLPGLRGVFVSLAREFVAAEVIALFVMRGGGLVRVSGEEMEFCGACVRGLRHGIPPLERLEYGNEVGRESLYSDALSGRAARRRETVTGGELYGPRRMAGRDGGARCAAVGEEAWGFAKRWQATALPK
jgi:hypothetical protein